MILANVSCPGWKYLRWCSWSQQQLHDIKEETFNVCHVKDIFFVMVFSSDGFDVVYKIITGNKKKQNVVIRSRNKTANVQNTE